MLGRDVLAVTLVVEGTIALLVVRVPSAALVAVAGRRGGVGVVGVDGAVVVRPPCAICVRHVAATRLPVAGKVGGTATQSSAPYLAGSCGALTTLYSALVFVGGGASRL